MPHKAMLQRKTNSMQTIDQAVDNYLTTLTTEGKSPHYVDWLRQRLKDFCKHLQELHENDILVEQVSLDDARSYIKALMERKVKYPHHANRHPMLVGLSPSTINGHARAIRSFGTFLLEEGYTEENIFDGLKPPKVPKVLIEPLGEAEIRRMLMTIPRNTAEGFRAYAILLLLLDTGIRLSEMMNLQVEDIDFSGGVFKVMGKGAKEREVPLGATASRALMRYLEMARPAPAAPASRIVFLTMGGQPITQQSVAQIMRRVAKRAGLKRLYPHLLRHTFAVRYLINGGDAFSLQKILGHESLDMTRRYVELANTDIKDKHQRFSPVDNLGISDSGRGRPRNKPRDDFTFTQKR
jgi:site-specific recombinase XerD